MSTERRRPPPTEAAPTRTMPDPAARLACDLRVHHPPPHGLTLGRGQAKHISRRLILLHAGRGVLAVAVLGLAACVTDAEVGTARAPARSGFAAGLAWFRVDFAYVSAYVLVRGRQAAVVDTGVEFSADRIGAALEAAGTGWDGVRHVLVTHAHFDHAGGLADVAARAPSANLYAGAADLAMIHSPPPAPPGRPTGPASPARRLRAVTDGEDVFGLRVVTTPGHTPGHIAVFDAGSSVLVAGDALTNTVDGHLGGALAMVTVDQAAAADSVRKLAALHPRVILVGHGPPVEHDAAARLRRLAASLPEKPKPRASFVSLMSTTLVGAGGPR